MLIETRAKNLSEQLGDVEFNIKDQTGKDEKSESNKNDDFQSIKVKKMPLILASPKFDEILCKRKDNKPIIIHGYKPEVFKALIRHACSGENPVKKSNVWSLARAAFEYDIPKLAEMCGQFLLPFLKVDYVLQYMENAIKFQLVNLQEASKELISRHTYIIIKQPYFCKISPNTLECVLKNADFFTPILEIFNACMDWAQKRLHLKGCTTIKGENIRNELGDLFYLIDLPCMTKTEFAQGPVKCGVLDAEEIVQFFSYFHGKSMPELVKKYRKRTLKNGTKMFLPVCGHGLPKTKMDSNPSLAFINHTRSLLKGVRMVCAISESLEVKLSLNGEEGELAARTFSPYLTEGSGSWCFPQTFNFHQPQTLMAGKKYQIEVSFSKMVTTELRNVNHLRVKDGNVDIEFIITNYLDKDLFSPFLSMMFIC